MCSPCDGYDEKQWPIDAAMIAAAPDLLAVARSFIELYLGLRDAIGPGVIERLQRADAAIAKAEGWS